MKIRTPLTEKFPVWADEGFATEIHKAIQLNGELAELPADAVNRIASVSKIQCFSRGQIIFEEGQKSFEAWVLVRGKAVLGYQTASGSASATCIAGRGDLFCCLPILDGGNYPVTAVSEAASEVLAVPGDLFREILKMYPDVFQNVLRRMCANLRAVECGHCHRVDRVPLRIMQTLVDLQTKHGAEIALTKWDVARLSGTTVETTIRVMAEMKKQKLILGTKEKIIIPDSEKLRVYLRGEKEFQLTASDSPVRKKAF